jgi:hypothetical protein
MRLPSSMLDARQIECNNKAGRTSMNHRKSLHAIGACRMFMNPTELVWCLIRGKQRG